MNTQDQIRMQSHKDPAQLEHEIDQQRSHIEQLVSALENKLSPSEMFDRLLKSGKGSGGDFAGNLMDTVKANPVPALLTAAGMLWLYSGRDRNPSAHSSLSGGTSTSLGITDPSLQSSGMTGMSGSDSGGALDTAKDKLGTAKDKVVGAKDHVAESASSAADSVRQRTRQGTEWFQQMLDENPLAVAAMAIGVGALLGSLLPETSKERELMGSASERVTGKLKDLAQTGTEQLAEAGREVTQSQGAGASTGKPGGASEAGKGDSYTGGPATTPTAGMGSGGGYTPSRPH